MIRLLTDRELEGKVVELVMRARRDHSIPEQCVGKDVCEILGLTLERWFLPTKQEGMLTDNNRVVINNQLKHISRIEYTIFHEIVHYLIEEDGELIDYVTEVYHDDPKGYEEALERCCQAGAAEFLMPRSRVQALIAKHGFSIDLIDHIEQLNGASVQASAVQLAVCAPIDCYVVLCTHGSLPRWPYTPALYVEQARKRDDSEFPLARGTTIPEDHLFHRVWKSKQPDSGPTYIPFRSGKTFPCEHAEAKMIGSRVAGILYLGRPPAQGQLGLQLFH